MLDKLREEFCWVLIFLLTQAAVFSYHFRDFETKFFPVVENFKLLHIYKFNDEYMEMNVSFDKVRDCDFHGIRVYTTDGIRVRVDFLDKNGDQYHSRHVGRNIAGPWRVWHHGLHDLQVDVLHKCDPFGVTRTVMQRSDIIVQSNI